MCVHMHASNEAYVGFHSGVISLHERILQFPSPFPILITRNSQLSFPGAHLTSHSFKDDIKAVDMIFSHLLMRLLALCVRVSKCERIICFPHFITKCRTYPYRWALVCVCECARDVRCWWHILWMGFYVVAKLGLNIYCSSISFIKWMCVVTSDYCRF